MSKTILVVDDDPTTNTMVNFLLKSRGYRVISAEDGEEGLEKINSERPDLIVLDVGMPKVDGFTFLNELKATRGSNMPKVIIFTGKEKTEDIFRMEGVDGFLRKPLDSAKFFTKVKECLGE